MNKTSACGSELQKQDSSQSVSNSSGSSELRARVALEWQMVREMIAGPLVSDEAAQLTITMMVDVAVEIGQERFHAAILKAIETCERRPTVATIRRIAGVNGRLEAQQEATASAWELVTKIVTRHIGRDAEGNVRLQGHLIRDGEVFREEPVPEIPEGVRRAVIAMGGWSSLADSHPTFWGARWSHWKELYVGDRAPLESSAMQIHRSDR